MAAEWLARVRSACARAGRDRYASDKGVSVAHSMGYSVQASAIFRSSLRRSVPTFAQFDSAKGRR